MLVPLIIACALFMENLDSSVVATSLPAIAADLGVDPIALKLAFTSYLLSIAVFTPISGWCADRFGTRLVFRGAIVIFTLGSILCGLVGSLEGFVAARIVQGLGGAMMVPVGRLVLLRSVERSDYVRALSWLTIPGLLGPVMGPPLGGFITTYFDWRYIFWVNVPIGIIGFILVSIHIADFRDDDVRRLDRKGFLLSGLGLAGLVFGLAASGIGLLSAEIETALIVGGALFLGAYLHHALTTPDPLIDLRLLKIVSFRTAVLGGLLFRIGIGALPFLLPLMLQIGFGLSAFQSGVLTFASAAGAMAMKFAAPPVLRRYGFRTVLLVNALLSAGFIAVCGLFTPATPGAVVFTMLLVGGFFRSLQFTAFNALGFADVPREKMSQATSFSSVMQQLSVALGVSVAAFVLSLGREARGGGELALGDFHLAFYVVAGISALSMLVALFLPRNAGAEVSGHRRAGLVVTEKEQAPQAVD
ncbi:MDR family MFS transporter [Methylobrevis pamukkalensis]|uniref:Putative transport protein HsrA n=1 Tax=Methylobrevis pamukkalensis TaxID=1439726 RepID=A0A1E3GX91_9HYPH|nr:MDR family MFS transporter [Methylobrevis pamukkalensis]ODN68677.1 putative transport protein HsrA [Methylobrevis pamukkalensis]